MPSKKKKYNSRFPPARIKKIMQTDEEIGKVSAAVPVLISKCLEMFLASILQHTGEVTKGKHAKTMSTSHLRECIQTVSMFDFLKDVVNSIPETQNEEEGIVQPTTEGQDDSKARSKPQQGVANKRLKLVKSESDLEIETDSDEKDGEIKKVKNTHISQTSIQTSLSVQGVSAPVGNQNKFHIPLENVLTTGAHVVQRVSSEDESLTGNPPHMIPQNPVDMTYQTLNTMHRPKPNSGVADHKEPPHKPNSFEPPLHPVRQHSQSDYRPTYGNGIAYPTEDTNRIVDFSYPYNPMSEHTRGLASSIHPAGGTSKSRSHLSEQDDYDI
uniref:Dr1-associated corepressor n=1 Tax=Ciona intestinalis TaxID=7719 RepID=H2XVZ1_CIOIN|nr:uncharacterized protein LOC100186645 [Ciona intestinalis]|eukprot:XP_026692485.1 uncharacterized protein LOC100186645 [Ciona intestinalis]